MRKFIGVFQIGDTNVNLFWCSEWGGDFTFIPGDRALPEICVGFASRSWERITTAMLHEAFEFEMTRGGCRFSRTNDYGNDLAGYSFALTHSQFSDICGRVSIFLIKALPAVSREFLKFNRPVKAKKIITKKRKP